MMSNFKMKVLAVTGRSILVAKKYSPEILVGVGLTSLVGCAIFAHESKPKALEVINEAKDHLGKIEEAKEIGDEEKYSKEDYRNDKIGVYSRSAMSLGKIYAPTVITGALGITSVLCAFGILKKRNLALIGAYKLMSKSYEDYRKRITDKYGSEVDRLTKNGIVKGETTGLENGEEDELAWILNPNEFSSYAKYFDESSVNWSKTPGYNFMFLKSQQDYANDLVMARGHVFLNEVYDMIGVPRTPEGALVGWVKGEGDGFVDFGIFDGEREQVRSFVNGNERTILLDFNVDGVVYDKI